MNTLASGLSYLDLQFLDTPRVIASVILSGPDGVAIIDPGPSSTLTSLRAGLARAGIAIADVRTILLTHIHLDHAGATGTLLAENPALRVYVHEKGAPHMVDPSKLMASATRLWGDDMDRLWGEMRPVPADAITVLRGGERIAAGGRDLEVAYTPGHASHHVSYFAGDAGIAFVGDTAGAAVCAGLPQHAADAAGPTSISRRVARVPRTDHALAASSICSSRTSSACFGGRALPRCREPGDDQRSGEGVAGETGNRRGA